MLDQYTIHIDDVILALILERHDFDVEHYADADYPDVPTFNDEEVQS
jgi:hypothetical protein